MRLERLNNLPLNTSLPFLCFSVQPPSFIERISFSEVEAKREAILFLFGCSEVNSGGYLPRRFGLMYKCDQYKHGTHLTSMARNEIHDFLQKILGFNHQRGFVPFIAKCVPVKCVWSLY